MTYGVEKVKVKKKSFSLISNTGAFGGAGALGAIKMSKSRLIQDRREMAQFMELAASRCSDGFWCQRLSNGIGPGVGKETSGVGHFLFSFFVSIEKSTTRSQLQNGSQ